MAFLSCSIGLSAFQCTLQNLICLLRVTALWFDYSKIHQESGASALGTLFITATMHHNGSLTIKVQRSYFLPWFR